jgi:general stress protein 26
MSDQQRFWDVLEDFHFCMATTHDGQTLRSRPMSPRVDPDEGVIRFLSEASSAKTEQIEANHDINLAFIAPKEKNFISVSGTASISRDRALIRELWNSAADAWFPGGPDSAEVVAITVSPSLAEWWDGESSKLKSMWEMSRARREDRKPDLTEHRKVSF